MMFLLEGSYFYVILLVIILIVIARVMSKALDLYSSSSSGQNFFAKFLNYQTTLIEQVGSPLQKVAQTTFSQISKKVEELGGDVLEIGAGAGSSLGLLRLPCGSSLVVVDNNPHFEEYFRAKLSKYPDINLKNYLVQSAVDMSNIPDNSFSVVFVIDVLCSIDEDPLRKMLQEIKRVLKPEGCFFFIEHVLDKPGTWRRTIQKLICLHLNIWPRLFGNCHCDKETWRYIQEAGFRSCDFTYTYVPKLKASNILVKIIGSVILYCIQLFISGHGKK